MMKETFEALIRLGMHNLSVDTRTFAGEVRISCNQLVTDPTGLGIANVHHTLRSASIETGLSRLYSRFQLCDELKNL